MTCAFVFNVPLPCPPLGSLISKHCILHLHYLLLCPCFLFLFYKSFAVCVMHAVYEPSGLHRTRRFSLGANSGIQRV